MQSDRRFVVALAASLTAAAALAFAPRIPAQEGDPAPAPRPPISRLVFELHTAAGDFPLLLVSPQPMAPLALPSIGGELALDPIGLHLLADGVPDGAGKFRFVVSRPPGVPIDLHGQALLVTAAGLQLTQPFGVWADGAPLDVVPAPAHPPAVQERVLPTVPDQPELGVVRAPVAVMHDPDRGEDRLVVWLLPEGSAPIARQQPGRRVGSAVGSEPSSFVDSSAMSGLSVLAAADSDDFPYRMNCKLWIHGPNGWFGGSGALIDPYHVITAGHCVYDPDELGGIADQILVGPAYDDNRSDPLPFGTANWYHNATREDPYLMWSGWSQSLNRKHDLAVIELDRPIGALTSWFGYGYSSDCSFYEANTFYAGSYPIDGHTGNDMYWRSGSFDYCPNSYELRFWRLGYGGESGSGYYWKNAAGDRFVQGVLSHGTTTLWHGDVTDIVKLNADKYAAIDDFLRAARPAAADLMPLGVSTSSSSVARGSTVDFTFRILNYGRTDFTSSWSYSIRLSSNQFISATDEVLAVGTSTGDIDSLDVGDLTVTVGIPSGIATGTWHLGVILTASDGNTSNNATASTDVVALTIL